MSIRLKWKACENVDGYYVYQYNKKKGKYIKIKKLEGAKRYIWVDKNKKSYEVSAMSYGRDARTVNVGYVDIGIEDQTGTITTYEKEGKYEITARAHNVVTGRIAPHWAMTKFIPEDIQH